MEHLRPRRSSADNDYAHTNDALNPNSRLGIRRRRAAERAEMNAALTPAERSMRERSNRAAYHRSHEE